MGIAERRIREKEQKKNTILDCAEQLFFSKGFRDTSVDDIANCAEYSKGTLYLYFKGKDEMFMNIFYRALLLMHDEFRKSLVCEKNGRDKIEAIGKAHFQYLMEYPDYYSVMKLYSSLELDFSQLEDIISQIQIIDKLINKQMIDSIIEGQKDGSIRNDMDAEMICLLLQSMSTGVFHRLENYNKMSIALPNNASESDIFKSFFELVGSGIS